MELAEYLFKNKIKIVHFAGNIRFHPAYIGYVVRKQKLPSKRLAELIEHETKGECTVDELMTKPEPECKTDLQMDMLDEKMKKDKEEKTGYYEESLLKFSKEDVDFINGRNDETGTIHGADPTSNTNVAG